MPAVLTGLSSMATRQVLADLAALARESSGVEIAIESVGGVDAARRVAAGEAFDLVLLASNALDALIAAGHLLAPRVDLVRSGVAAAVRAGAPRPAIHDEAALRAAVQAARSIAYSTGPSGVHLQKVFARWGLADTVAGRTVQAPPGVPVGTLVARGEVELGFQQLSELLHLPGIDVIGPLPPGVQTITVFSGAVGARSRAPEAARALLDQFAHGAGHAEVKRRHGMEPA